MRHGAENPPAGREQERGKAQRPWNYIPALKSPQKGFCGLVGSYEDGNGKEGRNMIDYRAKRRTAVKEILPDGTILFAEENAK